MPRPVGLICFICGREYGSASIDIHVKQCRKLWIEREKLKPEKLRRPLPVEPKVLGGTSSSSSSFVDRDAFNDAAFSSFNDQALVPCSSCGRTFLPEALVRHQKACTRARPLFKTRNAAMAKDVRLKRNATAPAAVCISASRVRDRTPKSPSPPTPPHQTAPHTQESLASRISCLEAMVGTQSLEVVELRRIVTEQQKQLASISADILNRRNITD